MKVSVFIATSLDGFIARENGELDWLPVGGGEAGGEDYGYNDFINSIDLIVMGRKTYEKVLSFGEWAYGRIPVIVLTSGAVKIPEHLVQSVRVMACTPTELVEEFSASGVKHIYVDGGKTIQGFLREGVIQQLIITRIPVLIGKGIPLFGPLVHDIQLRHVETHQYPNGLVQSRYEVVE